MSAEAETGAYALLADGTTIEIRPARPGDFGAVRDMHVKMSPGNLYLRFFGVSPVAAEREARRICRAPAPDHGALLAVLDGEVVGCASYEVLRDGSRSAEIAMAVADDMHKRGVGTLLLEHMISLARGRGVRAFVAETLIENALMMQVFADAGLPVRRVLADGVYDLTFPLPGGEAGAAVGTYRDAVAERERSADVASLRHVLTPESVAVFGAGGHPSSLGQAILQNIISGGFPRPVYAVNPSVAEPDGVRCVPSAAELPEQVDLAIITAPVTAVLDIAEECGRRGVRALVVITSGLDGAARAELLGICRRHGMRLVGPNCFGVANASIPLDATLAARHPTAGSAGLALQSGGVGVVLLEHLSRLGVGISSFVSLGDKDDVSGNDMLLWWESDPATKLAVLYLESFGNPRKFAHTARRVGHTKPVLAVNVARSAAGKRLAAVRGPAAEAPLLTRQALLEQAGVIAAANLGELIDTAALLASQPVPQGPRVAVLSNTRGGAMLAADACGDARLQVAALAADTQRALRDILPAAAAVAGPVATTAAVAPGAFRRCLELAGADPGVDAILALTVATVTSSLVPEVSAARPQVPIAAAVMDQVEAVRLLRGPEEDSAAVPAYAYPESAARALGHAARYGAWRATPPGRITDLEGQRPDHARELIASVLADCPAGGWLPPDPAAELLGCYGVRLVDRTAVATEDEAIAAAARFGGPVALKADMPGLMRRRYASAVLLDLHGADEVRRGFRSLRETSGGHLGGAIVQPMITGGVKVMISVLQEQVVGPLVLFGLGGAGAYALADRAARLAPLTDSDADDLIHSKVAIPMLLGRPGAAAVDIAALRDMLLRVSRLADDLPQVAELHLSPVIAGPDGVQAVDGLVRVQAAEPADVYLRRLQ